MILRKDAGAGRAEAASLPTRRNLSAAPSDGEEGPGSAASCLLPYAGQPPLGTAGRSLPSDGRQIQREQAASDTEEAAAQAIPFAPASADDDVERAEITPDD